MKRILSILLVFLLMAATLGGCSKDEPLSPAEPVDGNFEPETTVVASGGLTQAIDDVQEQQDVPQIVAVAASDTAIDQAEDGEAVVDVTMEPAADMPIVTPEPTPEPVNNSHTSIDGYSTIGNVGLEFSFSYPVNWNNLPGRSTVCYVQPMESGVTYPARVAVTMKKMAHRGTPSKVKEEFASYFEFLQSQYDEETFEVTMTLDTKTRFMGRSAMSTTYLAYDGEQEIKGYAICTYFERYMFVFHFLCAYEDYNDFKPAMEFMRDSVRTELVFEDD